MRALAASALFALGGAALPQPVAACSVCLPGDPIYSSHGTTAQSAGDFSVFLEGRMWSKKSGALPHGEHAEEGEEEEPPGVERNRSGRLDLYLSWTPVDRITLTVDLPWAWNRITEVDGARRETSHLEGFGDVVAQVTGVLWRNRVVLPSTWVEGRAFVKFPTGESRRSHGGVRDPHLQPGTGSYDFGFGAALVHRLDWAALYASVVYRENREGSLDYEYGDVVLTNVAAEVPLGHVSGIGWLDRFTPGLELNFRWAGYDRFGHHHYHDSGGSILYVTPSLRVALSWWSARGPSLRAAVQIPTTSTWLNGFQKEDPIWLLGLHYAF
jgi:hypothetical protein